MFNIVSKNKWVVILVGCVIFLRFFRLEEFTTFLGDQGRDAIIVKRIVTLEHFPAIGAPSSVGGVFLGPFYYYLISPFLLLFRFNPLGLSVGAALLSLLGIILSFILVRKLSNSLTSIFFLFFVTFSLTQVEFARFSWNPNLLPIFAFLTLTFYYLSVSRRQIIFSLLWGSFFALAFQLHHLAGLLILPLAVETGIHFFQNKKEAVKNAGAAFVSFIFFSLPLILFDIKHEFLNAKSFVKLFSEKDVVTKTSYFTRILETNTAFYKFTFNIEIPQLLALLFTIILVTFLLRYSLKKKSVFVRLHTLNFLLYILGFSLLNTFRYAHYYGVAYFSFFFILAFAAFLLFYKSLLFKTGIALFLIFYLVTNFSGYYFLRHRGSNQILRAKIIAQGIVDHNPQTPYQVISLPTTETNGHIRYFLEILSERPLPEDSAEQPKELYVLCYSTCEIPGDPQWQIAAFKNAKIDKIWKFEHITIYKVIHGKEK